MTNKFLGLDIYLNNLDLQTFLNKIDWEFRNMDSLYDTDKFTECHKAEFACDNDRIIKFVKDLDDMNCNTIILDKDRESGIYQSYEALIANARLHKSSDLFFEVMYDIIDYLVRDLKMVYIEVEDKI